MRESATSELMEAVLLRKHDWLCLDQSMSGLEGGRIRVYEKQFPSLTAREYKEPRMVLKPQE